MIVTGFIHTFMLVGPTGGREILATADLDERDASEVLDEVASAVASRLLDPEEHQSAHLAASRALERVEEIPGTQAMSGERLPGERLLRVFRHLAGDGPTD